MAKNITDAREWKRRIDDLEVTIIQWLCEHRELRLTRSEIQREFALTNSELFYVMDRVERKVGCTGNPPSWGFGPYRQVGLKVVEQ